MKHFTSVTQKKGELGERVAQRFLVDKGFRIIECNYTKKIGEIDIVAIKKGIIHFVEVKTLIIGSVPRETLTTHVSWPNDYSPFQNIGKAKMKKFSRVCALYLMEKRVSHETRWVMDAIAVIVSRETRVARVEVLWNIFA